MPATPRGSYTKPPVYQDQPRVVRNPLGGSGSGDAGGGGLAQPLPPTQNQGSGDALNQYVKRAFGDAGGGGLAQPLPPTQNQPSVVKSLVAPDRGPGDAGMGGITPPQDQQPNQSRTQGTAGSEDQGYGDMLRRYLDQAFGEGRSFDPVAQQIAEQRDDALTGMSERLASRGMSNSGLVDSGANDIYSQAGQNLASAYQDWREQGVQDMRSAISPFQETEQARDLMGFQTGELDTRDRNASDVMLDRLLGRDRDPNTGTMAEEAFWNKWGHGTPDKTTSEALDVRAEGDLGIAPSPGQSISGANAQEKSESVKNILDMGFPPVVLKNAMDYPNGSEAAMIRSALTKAGMAIPQWLMKE